MKARLHGLTKGVASYVLRSWPADYDFSPDRKFAMPAPALYVYCGAAGLIKHWYPLDLLPHTLESWTSCLSPYD